MANNSGITGQVKQGFFSRARRLLAKPFIFIAKFPGGIIWLLDRIFAELFRGLKTAADFADNVMLRPCHNTRPYKWYKGLGDSPKLAIWVVAVTFIWILSGSLGQTGGKSFGGGAPAADEVASVQIKISQAELYEAQIDISGVTEANHRLELRAQTAGTVKEILQEKGSALAVNQVFLALDNTIRDAELKQAQASYNQLQLESQAATRLAKGGYQSKVKANEILAQFARAEAALAQAKYNLEKSRFSAPFAGTLVDSPLDIGDYVSPGTFVGTVIDLNPIKINGYVSETEIKRLDVIGLTDITVEIVIGDGLYQGKLVFVSPSADARTRSFAVEVLVDNPDLRIRDGVPATLRLPTAAQNAHFISSAWLTLDSKGDVGIRVVGDDDIVGFLPVDIIKDSDVGVWIANVPNNIRIITVGQESVTAGEKVIAVADDNQ